MELSMKRKTIFNFISAGICLATLAGAGTVHAEEAALNLDMPITAGMNAYNSRFTNPRPYLLALNESDVNKGKDEIPVDSSANFEPPLFTGSNAHKYLGLGTLALVIATAIVPKPPEMEDRSPTQAELDAQKSSSHAKLGRAAATMAVATVATGLLAHWNDFHLEDGLSDPDNQHALLGTAGALAILFAVSKAPEEGHAGKGIAGGAAMAVAVKLTW
jgi:hypothetical protein